MLKVNKYEYIKESDIECICSYDPKSFPLSNITKLAREENRIRESRNSGDAKTLIQTVDNLVCVCPYLPVTYMAKLEENDYIMINTGCFIKKEYIREVTIKTNKSLQRVLKQTKEENKYVNLTFNKGVTNYIFMKSGKVYGVHMYRFDFESIVM